MLQENLMIIQLSSAKIKYANGQDVGWGYCIFFLIYYESSSAEFLIMSFVGIMLLSFRFFCNLRIYKIAVAKL